MTQPTPNPTVDLAAAAAAAGVIQDLLAEGWTLSEDAAVVVLVCKPAAHPLDAADRLRPILAVAANVAVEVAIVGRTASHELRIRLVHDSYTVVAVPDVPPAALFEGDALDSARLAWEGDADAAANLPLIWQVEAVLALEHLITCPDWVSPRVGWSSARLAAEYQAVGPAADPLLVPANREKRRLVVGLDANAAPAHLGQVTLVSVRAGTPTALVALPPTATLLPGETAAARANLVAPSSLLQSTGPSSDALWAPAVARCRQAAATAFWGVAASEAEIYDGLLRVAYLGFKRSSFDVPGPGDLTGQDVEAALALREWALADANPDRLLALRQVVSLYDGDEAVRNASDVLFGAETVYAGLRTEAVAEALKGARDAQANAAEAVRQTLAATQGLIKLAAERLIAALGATGAIAVANASSVVGDRATRNLLLVLAAFLAVLAAVSGLLEGPLLLLPLDGLDDELTRAAPLVTASQRALILTGKSVVATRMNARRARLAAPALMLAAAVLIAVLGVPSRYH